MSRAAFIFGAWCLLVTSGFAYASFSGYSPFANGARSQSGPGGVFMTRGGGPRHK